MSITTPCLLILPPDSAASVHLSSLLAVSVTVPPGLLILHFLRGCGVWVPDEGLGCCCLLTWARISWIFLWASWKTRETIRPQHKVFEPLAQRLSTRLKWLKNEVYRIPSYQQRSIYSHQLWLYILIRRNLMRLIKLKYQANLNLFLSCIN